jgi:hypothetical protein
MKIKQHVHCSNVAGRESLNLIYVVSTGKKHKQEKCKRKIKKCKCPKLDF